ncbi:MAG: hypothetical protein AMXMBFR33_21320 [Candidatus Xenobia bacterium]
MGGKFGPGEVGPSQGENSSGMRRGFSLIEIAVAVAILALLLGIGLPYLAGLRESNRIEAAYQLIHGTLEFAQQEARTQGLPPLGLTGAGAVPPFPDTDLYCRVVRKELGQPARILKEYPIGRGFSYLVNGDVVSLDADGGATQGIIFQIAPKLLFTSGTCIVFGQNGQPVTMPAGAPVVAVNAPTVIFGTKRRAVEIKMLPTGALQSTTMAANPL